MRKFLFLLVIIFVAAVYSGMAGEETQRIRIGTSRPPAYFPGNGVSVTFSENDCFTFLWPKKWSSKSELKFLLVKLKDGQKPEEAILSNTPVFQQDGIKTHYLDYPLKADPLDYGEYVWQLQNEKGKVLLRTQFNIDSIGNSGYEVERVDNGWMYMKEKLDGSYHDADDKILKIHVEEPYAVRTDQHLRFCVYDEHRNVVLKTNELGTVVEYAASPISSPAIQTGENWVSLSLGDNCNYNQNYYLEVWDSKGGKSFLRFRCVPLVIRLIRVSEENN
jgi:hypothetical protein